MNRRIECPKCGDKVHTEIEHVGNDGEWLCDDE